MRRFSRRSSLFWRVFAVNAVLLIGAAFALAASPATVSFPVKREQGVILALGVVAVLAANAALLRASLRPLEQLAQLMRRIDLLHPGERLTIGGARELVTVAAAFNQMLDRLEDERRVSSTRSVGAQEAERRRIASDLHDEIGQSLTALLLQLRALAAESAVEEPRLVQAQSLARQAHEEVRRVARQLRPSVLDDLGLGYALVHLVGVMERSADFVVRQRIDVHLERLESEVELALYRIAQEALTNVMRHAEAARVEVTLEESKGTVLLKVADDGRGMIYAADLESGGIRGMRERALAVGVDLTIRSRAGGGTAVVVAAKRRRSW